MRYLSFLTAIAVTTSAQAATAVVDQGTYVPGQGQVSHFSGQKGLYEERFNGSNSNPAAANYYQNCVQQRQPQVVINYAGGDQNGNFVQGVQYDTTNGPTKGGIAAIPPGSNIYSLQYGISLADQSCYLAMPAPGHGPKGDPFEIDITPGAKLSPLYFGFYWGSLDSYNRIQLFSRPDKLGNTATILVPGLSESDGTITGQDIMNAYGLKSGSSFYLSFRFTAAENFGVLDAWSTNYAFEVDNLAFATTDFLANTPPGGQVIGGGTATGPRQGPFAHANFASELVVPEPAPTAMFALGLTGLIAARRRRG